MDEEELEQPIAAVHVLVISNSFGLSVDRNDDLHIMLSVTRADFELVTDGHVACFIVEPSEAGYGELLAPCVCCLFSVDKYKTLAETVPLLLAVRTVVPEEAGQTIPLGLSYEDRCVVYDESVLAHPLTVPKALGRGLERLVSLTLVRADNEDELRAALRAKDITLFVNEDEEES